MTPKSPKNDMDKGKVLDGLSKSRAEKRPRSRASADMQRDATPESRHVARIMTNLHKADENAAAATTISQKVGHQETEMVATSISQCEKSSRVDSPRTGTGCNSSTTEQTQVLKAPLNFGKKWSAPPRNFENVSVGASSSSTKPSM
jgi:hypothetical protein